MDRFYLSVVRQLKNEVPELSWIDWDTGQLYPDDEEENGNYTVTFPCALITIPDVDYSDIGRGVQQGDLLLQIKLGIDSYSTSHIAGGVEAPDLVQSTVDLQLIKKINKALHGFGGYIIPGDNEDEFIDNHFSRLMREKVSTEQGVFGLKIFNLAYSCVIRDHSSEDDLTAAQITDITINQSQQ
jgi:hypothetical protein